MALIHWKIMDSDVLASNLKQMFIQEPTWQLMERHPSLVSRDQTQAITIRATASMKDDPSV